jgi:predicted DNA-binding transcriptional regulator YafY
MRLRTGHLLTGFRGKLGTVRADRLVAVLLLLQSRKQVTAAEVAAELEISERTARRDLEALSMAGVPVYSRQGRNGGWQLVGGARTDLSGLTAAEARALFLVAGPSSSTTPELKAALRKLVRALPEPFREHAEAASSAVVVDPVGWSRRVTERPAPRFLEAVQHAVVEGRQVHLGYVARDGTPSTRVVHPLGLASKGPSWYLVADTDTGLRTFKVDRMTSVEPTGEKVVRPDGFDLAEAWRMITEEVGRKQLPVRAHGFVAPDAVGLLRMILGTRVRLGPAAADGRVEVEVSGWSEVSVAGELAGLGSALELVEPPGVRAELARIAKELAATYTGD